MKPSDTVITRIAAAIPKTGCFSPNTFPPSFRFLFCAGIIPQRDGEVRGARKKQMGRRSRDPRPVFQRFREELLLVVAAASGENSAVRHGDLGLADPIRFRLLGTNAADLYLVADFQ